MSPSYRNPKCRHSRERHTADLEFCRHRLLIVTVMVRRQDNDQMRDVHVSVSTIHDGIRFVPCHHETADEQDTITGAGPIVERFDDDHVDQTLQWRLCLRASENERVWDVTSGGSDHMTPARFKGQVHSLSPIKLKQELSMSSPSMSTTFYTTLLPGRLIQSVLPLSSLTAAHLFFAAFCQSPQISTKTKCTDGKYSMTLGLFESQYLPESRTCEKNDMATATTFRYTFDTSTGKFILPTRSAGNVPHTTPTENLVAVHPRSSHLTDSDWHKSSDSVLIDTEGRRDLMWPISSSNYNVMSPSVPSSEHQSGDVRIDSDTS